MVPWQPTQADSAGRMHSLGLLSQDEAHQLYNLGRETRTAVDPRLLQAIEEQAVIRARRPPMRGIQQLIPGLQP